MLANLLKEFITSMKQLQVFLVLRVGRKPDESKFITIVGHFSGIEYARKAMGINWMTKLYFF